jgi:insecticidal toxin
LLESDNVLPEQAQRPIRRRLNSARGHSLVSNPHLGRSLRDLDSHWWGQQIAQATDALQDLHASAKPLVPLFETLEITPAGEYRINLIDPAQSEHVVQVVSSDHRLLRIRNYLSEQFSVLGTRATPQMVEAGAVHTLNTGFTIQALMNVLRGREGDDRTLTTAVRLHAYVNYAQLVHGNVTDVAGLLSLIKTALNEENHRPYLCASGGRGAGTCRQRRRRRGAGPGQCRFRHLSIGDGRQRDRARAVRHSVGLRCHQSGVDCRWSGSRHGGRGDCGSVLGGAGVVLGGLAVGVAALAQGFARIAGQAQEVGLFFDALERACRGVGYRYGDGLGAWIAHPSLVVRSLDFNRAMLVLDSPKVYRLRDHFGVPGINPDDQQALDLRRELGLPGYIRFDPPSTQLVVLPARRPPTTGTNTRRCRSPRCVTTPVSIRPASWRKRMRQASGSSCFRSTLFPRTTSSIV